jgi:hypothetical protein
MAIAEYYERVALAASQVIAGFTPDLFRRTLEQTNVGLAIDREAASSSEGRVLADLSVRLLARLYPFLDLRVELSEEGERLENIARAINPRIEFQRGAEIGLSIGAGSPAFKTTCFAGSNGWDAMLSFRGPVPTGSTPNPLGAGAAACLAASNIFNHVLIPDSERHAVAEVRLSTFLCEKGQTPETIPNTDWSLAGDAVLVGVGAVGNGAVWALGRSPLEGTIHLVDHESLELSNLQRYVLAVRSDEGALKVDIAREQFRGDFTCMPHAMNWAEFVQNSGYNLRHVLVAVDSADARRSVQAALPEWIANAWTQPGDLGVSVHDRFDGVGACLACLYLPSRTAPNEDELVADALGIPEHVSDVRTLLHNGGGVSRPLLEAVAQGRNLQLEAVLPYEGKSIRELYVEGICGGGIIPLGVIGLPPQELHVPLAHQSTLAGILLGGALVRRALGTPTKTTMTTRIDIGSPLGDFLTQPTLKGGTGKCLCEDQDYIGAFRSKFGDDHR